MAVAEKKPTKKTSKKKSDAPKVDKEATQRNVQAAQTINTLPRIGNILLVTSVHKSNDNKIIPSFCGIPMDDKCPFVELMFDPETKTLGVITKHKKPMFQLVPKIDNLGQAKRNTGRNSDQLPYHQERHIMDTYHEQYIRTPEEIDAFLKMYAINDDFNWNQFLV